jgi:DNA-binding transcriptional LysR family regulator
MDVAVARTFLEIVKTGSFVNAAANLYVTQTAVGARIRGLEDELRQQLFIRSKHGARLTPAGEQFLRFATSFVQIWEGARRAVSLPPGRETLVTVGAELALANPLLPHWLRWMNHHHPEIAVSAQIDTADALVERVQEGSLDVAILYAAPSYPGLVAELLIEEKLVLLQTTAHDRPLGPEDYIEVDWGPPFAAGRRAAFPDAPTPAVTITYGPIALDYLLSVGGSGYFRLGFARPYLEDGRLMRVPDSPEFSYSAFAVHATRQEEGPIGTIREGLRAAASLIYASYTP